MQNPNIIVKNKYWSTKDSYAYCTELCKKHYENFPVASLLLPKHLRKHVAAIYAFARIADDYADETGYTLAERIDNLNNWEQHLEECYNGNPTHRVFAALSETIERFQIPIEPFKQLLTAFKSDVTTKRYNTFEDVLAYCNNSANPIGRLMLILFNYHNKNLIEYSDAICTALQLTNFWQDISVDIQKDRIYIPQEDLLKYGYTEKELYSKIFNDNFARLMEFEIMRTEELFVCGKNLLDNIEGRFFYELKLTYNGGMRILQNIRSQNYNVLSKRPKLSFLDKFLILLKTISN